MIYLIEDKTSRRNDYGWSDKRIAQYKDTITAVDSIQDLLNYSNTILSSDNIVLYHESFANTADYDQKIELGTFLNEIKSQGLMVAYFSGSKSQRTLDSNVCNLPPHAMYANLEHFINMHSAGDTDFKYLMFGKNPELEDKIREAIISTNSNNVGEDKVETSKTMFFFIASDESLEPPYENASVNDSFDFDCDDTSLSNVIQEDLNTIKFDAIYVPLCFGETLSDFLGLRLAMLIRFTKTKNKLTPIIIYGEADYQDIITNECFDILKMPGVYYVHSDYPSLTSVAQFLCDISESEYNTGLSSIHLNIPSDIGDNHSVANKWAIHRWAHALNIYEEMDFNSNEDKVTNCLYFKFLNSINSFKKNAEISAKSLAIDTSKCKSTPKVLLIDDQADDGWYEALCSILYDKNGIEIDYIGEELKQRSCEDIVNCVKEKVLTYSPDIVILDLRLCASDFGNKSIKELTGNRVLRSIKQINRGIQVLMFSSTSKVWNYQFLCSEEGNIDGVDGFIVKERPEDSKDPLYTRTIIKHFIASFNQCCKLTFRKELWEKMQNDIIKCNSSFSEYGEAVAKLLELAEDSLFAKQANFPYASIFMNLFRVVEATANRYIDDFAIQDTDGLYYFQFRDGHKLLKFNKDGKLVTDEVFKHERKSLPYQQKICNTLHYLGTYNKNTYKLVDKRNAFTHPDITKQNGLEEFNQEDVWNAYEIVHNLIQNQIKI